MGSPPCLTLLASRILPICWAVDEASSTARTEFAVGRFRGRRTQRDQHPKRRPTDAHLDADQLRTDFEGKTAGARKRPVGVSVLFRLK
jgi:hypothetical protein